jgi:lactate racemase
VIESTESVRGTIARASDSADLITYVEKPGEKFLFSKGERFVWDTLPVGTRIVHPRPSLPALADPDAAIEHALDHPLGADPLSAKLRPGMKVTIAFDDISLPLPQMVAPDVRRRVITILLRRLAAAGVTDIHLIVAVSLHRHMTEGELRAILGDDIMNAYWPDRLYNHDAEDPDGNVFLGETEHGEVVEINKRAVESDLLIYVNINLVSMDGGHKSVPVGLATYRSVRAHHTVHAMMHSRSYMDPENSALHQSCDRMGKIVAKHVDIFTIETTLNTKMFPPLLGYLNKREKDYTASERAQLFLNRKALDLMPLSLNRQIFQSIRSPYGLTGVNAGETGAVHAKTLENVYAQQLVQVEGQADILIYGLAHICPYNVNSIMNPILVMCLGLGYMFNFYKGRPLVRKGGVMIFHHPVEYKFHRTHHPSYIDFFETVLTKTTDSSEIEKMEESFAYNERYRELYRHHNAFHGVHPFYMWYWGTFGQRHVAKAIFVNPVSEAAVRRMGFDVAPTLAAAIEMAQSVTGAQSQITWHRVPPISMVEVV